jgi:hypothetical protein
VAQPWPVNRLKKILINKKPAFYRNPAQTLTGEMLHAARTKPALYRNPTQTTNIRLNPRICHQKKSFFYYFFSVVLFFANYCHLP